VIGFADITPSDTLLILNLLCAPREEKTAILRTKFSNALGITSRRTIHGAFRRGVDPVKAAVVVVGLSRDEWECCCYCDDCVEEEEPLRQSRCGVCA